MSELRQATNPFYVLLVLVGVLFVLTASAYGMMTLRMIEPAADQDSHELVTFMERHGFTALMIELGVLAVATVAAIGTDSWWTRRAEARSAAAGRAGRQPSRPQQADPQQTGAQQTSPQRSNGPLGGPPNGSLESSRDSRNSEA